MKQELDNKLCTNYPLIFANRHGSAMETLMCWGFDCGDGWYDLIDTLCGEIQHHIDNRKRNREVLLKKETFDPNMVPEEIPQVIAVQVKEKFGSLRFYYDGGDDYINGVVRMAESMSCKICMTCGKPGEMVTKGWWHVACDEHWKDDL